MNSFEKARTASWALALCLAGAAFAEPADDPSEVLARRGEVVLTQRAIDAAFHRIPRRDRLDFIRDGSKVQQLMGSLLLGEVLAARARGEGFDDDPLMQERMRLAATKELADAWLDRVVEQAPRADLEALAHEVYLAHPERFQTEPAVDVSHILISKDGRLDEDAAELASSLKQRLDGDPGLWDEFVREFSEDPTAEANGGRFPAVRRGDMVAPFENQAFAMSVPGEISEPVESRFGFHLIRFNRPVEPEMLPFDSVKARIMRREQANHEMEIRGRYIAELTEGAVDVPEGAIEIMLKRWFGEDLEHAPDYSGAAAEPPADG